MFTAKLKFRQSVVVGKEGSLYYQLIRDRVVRQVPTPFRIYPEEWDFHANRIVIHPSSDRSSYLESVLRTTYSDIQSLEDITEGLTSARQDVSPWTEAPTAACVRRCAVFRTGLSPRTARMSLLRNTIFRCAT